MLDLSGQQALNLFMPKLIEEPGILKQKRVYVGISCFEDERKDYIKYFTKERGEPFSHALRRVLNAALEEAKKKEQTK